MSDTGHTPLPWNLKIREDGDVRITDARGGSHYIKLASPWLEGSWEDDAEAKANAAYIVTACNALPILVEALQRADIMIKQMSDVALHIGLEGTSDWDMVAGGTDMHGVHETIRAALASIKGGSNA